MHNDLKELFWAKPPQQDPIGYIKAEEKLVRELHGRAIKAEKFILSPQWGDLLAAMTAKRDAIMASWSPRDAPEAAVAAMAGIRALEFVMNVPHAEIAAWRARRDALTEAKSGLEYSEPDPEPEVS